MQDAASLLFTLSGRVESRRALPPAAGHPRMEVSFSGTLASPWFGPGSGACTFEAEPDTSGVMAMQGFGSLFLPEGFVLFDLNGIGRRDATAIVHEGALRLRSGTWPAGLPTRLATFRYVQDLTTLAVTLHTAPWAASFATH